MTSRTDKNGSNLCIHCGGTGRVRVKCFLCGGGGYDEYDPLTVPPHNIIPVYDLFGRRRRHCPACFGEGYEYRTCSFCGGTGIIDR